MLRFGFTGQHNEYATILDKLWLCLERRNEICGVGGSVRVVIYIINPNPKS